MLDFFTTHTSVRAFEAAPLPEATKQQLLNAAHGGSSSNFVQATSVIEITDPANRAVLGDLAQSAPYVKQSGAFYVFVADLYRQSHLLQAAGQPLTGIQNMEALLVSVVDTTIAAQSMALAAESMGLGICYIGGIRNDLAQVRDLLNLPKFTVPLFGLTVGVPTARNEVKPRMPQANWAFTDGYDAAASTDLDGYVTTTNRYYAQRSSNAQATDWAQKMVAFFASPRREDVAQFMTEQGFELK